MADYTIEVADETGTLSESRIAELERAATLTLSAEAAGPTILSVALLGDEAIARINADYLSHDGPTDVISFPLAQPGLSLVGDIYIGLEQARRQAVQLDVPVDEELIRLVVHGTLHTLGWDHPEGVESPMYTRQEEIVARILAGD